VENETFRALTCQKAGHCILVDFVAVLDAAAAEGLAAELAEVCERIAWDEEARVIVLAFDGAMPRLSCLDSGHGGKTERASLVECVARLRQPVIAAIRGNAMGLGLELALACDIRLGTENARFGLPQVCEGSIPSEGGTQRLPRLIGQGKALQMILTGESIDAGEACRIGLINRIISPSELMSAAMEMAQQMATKSPLSLSYAKEALHHGRDLTLDQGLKMELDLYLILFCTTDRVEGITAFREKRTPKFEGA
jgi:enoyl-CoA hydratase